MSEWKDIKLKLEKDNLLISYVFKLKDLYDLNSQEVAKVMSQIQTAIQTKVISPTDIILADGEIEEIVDMEFSEEGRCLIFMKETNPSIKIETVGERNELIDKIKSFVARSQG